MSWGVPLFALGIEPQGGRGVRQDLREQYQQFLRSGFQTQIQMVQEEIDRKVFGYARGVRSRFNLEDLTIGTMEQRANVVNILVQRTGVLTPNEGREIMGLEPLEDPMANELGAATGAPAPEKGAKPTAPEPDGGSDGDEDPQNQAEVELERMFGDDWKGMDLTSPAALSNLKAELFDFANQTSDIASQRVV